MTQMHEVTDYLLEDRSTSYMTRHITASDRLDCLSIALTDCPAIAGTVTASSVMAKEE
jgi:hypothetical protein